MTPGPVAAVVTGLLAGVAAALLIRPWTGLLVGGVVIVVVLVPRLRWLLSLFPALAVLFCGAFVVWSQTKNDWRTDINWPTHFWQLRTLGWLAVLALASDALIGLVRRAEPGEQPPLDDDSLAPRPDDDPAAPPSDDVPVAP